MRLLYDLLFLVFVLVSLPGFLMKGRHLGGGLKARLGFVPDAVRASLAGRRVVWIHAVSVGEMIQAMRLASVVKEKSSGTKVLLTVSTPTGWEVAQKIKNDEDTLLYFPLDLRGAVKRFIRSVGPKVVILLETEIWPNLIWELTRRRVPVYIVNGRISDRAIGRYRKVKGFLRWVLKRVAGIGAQDERMRERFIELGARPERVHVTGNIKFDWQPPSERSREADRVERLVRVPGTFLLIAGSTHEGEEEALFGLYRRLRLRHEAFRLLVAPRHLERMPSIEAAASRAGVTLARLSLSGTAALPPDSVWVLDQMGVLASVYRTADAVFVGGSLVPKGGHNLVEPAFYEKPLFFGPWMDNFAEMAEAFLGAGAAVQVRDAEDLERQVGALISDRGRAASLGQAARLLVGRHQGATRRNIEAMMAAL